MGTIWEFPKIRGTVFWGPSKGSYYLGYYIRVPLFSETLICSETVKASAKVAYLV